MHSEHPGFFVSRAKRSILAEEELSLQARSTLCFLREEIERSSALLRDLAEILAGEIAELAEQRNVHSVETSIIRMSQSLQSEDRIQQRLQDVNAALSALEEGMDPNHDARWQDLYESILGKLRLEEMKAALAAKVQDKDLEVPVLSEPKPSVGEIDLF